MNDENEIDGNFHLHQLSCRFAGDPTMIHPQDPRTYHIGDTIDNMGQYWRIVTVTDYPCPECHNRVTVGVKRIGRPEQITHRWTMLPPKITDY